MNSTKTAAIAIIAISLTGCSSDGGISQLEKDYIKAEQLLEEKSYQEALDLFISLGDYKNSKERVDNFIFVKKSAVKRGRDYSNDDLYEYEFDENCNLLKKTEKYGTSAFYTLEQQYDEKGRLILRSEYSSENDKEDIYQYTYDDNNNLIRCNNHFFSYDINNNMIKDECITDDGDYWSCIDYEYDSNNNLIKKTYNNNDTDVKTWKYDANNNCIQINTAYCNIDYQYDSNNNLVHSYTAYTESYKTGSTPDTECIYEYSPNNNCIQEIIIEGNSEIKYIHKYDENHRCIKTTTIKDNGESSDTTFEYDKYNNCIKKYTNSGTINYTYELVGYKEDNLINKYAYIDSVTSFDGYIPPDDLILATIAEKKGFDKND